MVDTLSYFSFRPVLHYWCSKGCGMCNPVSGILHIKDPLLLIKKSSPRSGSSILFYFIYICMYVWDECMHGID